MNGGHNVGGIIGLQYTHTSTRTIMNCHAYGTVEAIEEKKVGELIGTVGVTHQGRNRCADKILKRVIVKRDGKTPLILVTNDLQRSSEEIAELYKQRWQIELFFKCIKQNLKIKKFLGRSENAVKTQICIAIIAFVLIRLMQNLKEFCKKVPLKTLITIAKNGLFTKLSTKPPSRKHSEAFKQLHFNLLYDY